MSGIVQHRQASAQAILVFMAGLLASVLVFMYLTEVEAESAESVFVAESADRAIDIEHHVQTLNQKLNSLVSFFEASKEVTEEEFIRFVQHAFDLEHDKSFRYLAWYPLRTKSAVTNLPEPLNARFVLGSLPGPNRFPKNILSMPGAHTALIEAIRTESASVSQVISHPVFGPEGVGALVFYPVFDLHDSVGKHHGLREMLLGVIEMAETISGENVISRRVAQDPKGLDIYVYDNDARASVADPVYIHHSRARVLKAPSLNIEKAAQGLFFRYDIAFGNQTWTIIARALHGRMGVDIGTWMSLISSVFASFVVAVLWFIYARRNQTVKELVATRTQALQDREAHLNAIVESAVDAIITIDEAGGILTFNKSAERIFGYADVEVVGRNIKCLMPENTAQQHDGYLDAYKRTGEKKIIGVGRREIARRKDGSEFPIDLSISEFFSGNRKMYAGIIRDISDRIATENKMKKSETRYKMMLENAADAIYLHDGQGQIVDVNEHACDSVGYSREELTHMSVFELDSSFSPGALLELWNENGAQNFPISLLSSHRRKNGEVFP